MHGVRGFRVCFPSLSKSLHFLLSAPAFLPARWALCLHCLASGAGWQDAVSSARDRLVYFALADGPSELCRLILLSVASRGTAPEGALETPDALQSLSDFWSFNFKVALFSWLWLLFPRKERLCN